MGIELNKYRNEYGAREKVRRLLWEIVWATLFRPTPRWCLNGWRNFLLRVFGAKIGKGARINGRARIWQPWRLTVGDNSWVDGDVSLYSVDVVRIGSNTVISEGAFVCTAEHDISSEAFGLKSAPVAVGDCAWICARSVILPGASVGEGAVVAAGAVVTRNVEPWTVVGGNPAKFIKKRVVNANSTRET